MTKLIVVNLMESLDVFIMISVQCGILAERTLCSVQVQQGTTASWWRLQLQDDEGCNYNYMMTRWEEEADSNQKKVLKFVYIFLQCIRCIVQALTDPAVRRIFKHCWKNYGGVPYWRNSFDILTTWRRGLQPQDDSYIMMRATTTTMWLGLQLHDGEGCNYIVTRAATT
jgi:hypothetical protein